MAAVRHTGILIWILGIAVIAGLTVWSGAEMVAQAVASVGWGAALIVLVRIATVSTAGIGWWLLFAPAARPSVATCVALRFVREGINTLLPMAQVGGDLIGARLVTFRGIAGPVAAANIIVDILLQAATQFAFAIVGLAMLIWLEGDGPVARGAAAGLALAAIALVGFYLAQRRAGERILAAVLNRFAGDRKWLVLGTVEQVFRNLGAIYAERRRLLASAVVHLVGWIIGTLEVLIALALMGHPVSFAEALVIESLMHAIRGAAFVVPSALGAQEGGLLVLCAIFGIPADAALAVSLLKRVADLVVGVPGLIGWQFLEGARLRHSAQTAPEPRPGRFEQRAGER